MALEEYRRKRDFTRTPEPSGEAATERPPAQRGARAGGAPDWDSIAPGQRFCVQQPRATRMHFDFRLEHDGVLLSLAGSLAPPWDPADDFEASRARGDIKFRLSGTKISGEFALIHIGERGRRYGGSSDGDK